MKEIKLSRGKPTKDSSKRSIRRLSRSHGKFANEAIATFKECLARKVQGQPKYSRFLERVYSDLITRIYKKRAHDKSSIGRTCREIAAVTGNQKFSAGDMWRFSEGNMSGFTLKKLFEFSLWLDVKPSEIIKQAEEEAPVESRKLSPVEDAIAKLEDAIFTLQLYDQK